MLAFTIPALFMTLAVLGPLFGADSRDGLDWTPDHFRLRRLTAAFSSRAGVRRSRRGTPAQNGR